MNLKRKIRAFTLIEMLVVMILSSIIFGVIYASFYIVSNQYEKYRKNSGEVLSLNILAQQINIDFIKSDVVFAMGENIKMVKNNDTINYILKQDNILRTQRHLTDTFEIKVSKMDAFFESQETVDHQKIIDELIFKVNFHEKDLMFHLKKDYPTDILLKYNYKWLAD